MPRSRRTTEKPKTAEETMEAKQKAAEERQAAAQKEVEEREEATPDAAAYGDPQSPVEEEPLIKDAEQVQPADAGMAHVTYEEQAAGQKDDDEPEKAPAGHKNARVVFDGIGYQPESEGTLEVATGGQVVVRRTRVRYADKGDVVALTDSEFERLEALGAIEGA